MARILLTHKFIILSLFLFVLLVEGESHKFSRQLSPKSDGPKEKKHTNLIVFLHERNGGDHPTVMEVAKGAMTNTSGSKFGLTIVKDEELKEDFEPTSRVIGRAQGIGSYVGLEKPALTMVFSYVFLVGKYNESTLSVVGTNPHPSMLREYSIVGGTGLFLDARGHVVIVVWDRNETTGDNIDAHNIMIVHD